ncbi:hypothetical protein Aduo_008836 [Ancylostoma duodenale]
MIYFLLESKCVVPPSPSAVWFLSEEGVCNKKMAFFAEICQKSSSVVPWLGSMDTDVSFFKFTRARGSVEVSQDHQMGASSFINSISQAVEEILVLLIFIT